MAPKTAKASPKADTKKVETAVPAKTAAATPTKAAAPKAAAAPAVAPPAATPVAAAAAVAPAKTETKGEHKAHTSSSNVPNVQSKLSEKEQVTT